MALTTLTVKENGVEVSAIEQRLQRDVPARTRTFTVHGNEAFANLTALAVQIDSGAADTVSVETAAEEVVDGGEFVLKFDPKPQYKGRVSASLTLAVDAVNTIIAVTFDVDPIAFKP